VRHRSLAALALCTAVLGGCRASARSPTANSASIRAALVRYMPQIEPIRLAVNQLLEGADPVLGAFHEHRIAPSEAAARMAALERRFARFTVDVAAIQPRAPALRALHAEYAQTYVLEDAYLSALASGLSQRRLADLPNTQSAQRAAIIRWRTGLTVLAKQSRVVLPADLQQAGRGEIAPSPGGS
jgi:hypothetical protein